MINIFNSLNAYSYLSKLPKGNESNEETFKMALEKFFSVHFFCCEVAKITKQYVLDYNLKVALSILISIRLFSAQGLSPKDEAYKAIKRQIKSIMFTVYIRYFCYLTGKFSCVGVSELVSQFVSQELSSFVSNFVKEIEEEFSKNPPPAPEHSKLFYFSNYPIIDLAKVEVIDISDNSDNEEVWHRFEKLKIENEVKRREVRKRPITKTKLKVGSVICISDDEETSLQTVESSCENRVERAAKVITEASGLLSKFMDMNSSSKLTLKISKEELSLHIDPGSPERRSSSDEDLQRSHFVPAQYPYNSNLGLREEAPVWTPNVPPYVLSTADGRCYYAPYNPAEFPRVPLESNNINRLTLNTSTTNQNLDRISMKDQENRFYLWTGQQCVEERNFDPSGFFPQDREYYEEYRENNNLPTPVIMPQSEVAVMKTEFVDVANSPEPVIGEEVPEEASLKESVQLLSEDTSIIAAETTSGIENIELGALEKDHKYVAETTAYGNLLLLSQVITDIVSSKPSPKKYNAIMDSDENLNLKENKTLDFEPPSLTHTPEQFMLIKEDSTRERDDPMKYVIAVKNCAESNGCDDNGLLNLSSTGELFGEVQEFVKPALSEFKAGKPQSESFSDRSDLSHQKNTCIHALKPARVPHSYLQDPRVSLLQYEAVNDSLRLETTDSSDSEMVLKIDDCGIRSPETSGNTETKISPNLVYGTARKTIKTLETKAERKEDVVKVPSDESEDDLPLQYRLIKYQHLNQGKSTPVSPPKRSYKGRLAQNEGKTAGKKRRHNDNSSRFYTSKLRSCSKSSIKEGEVRTAFRSRGRPRKKSSRVRGKNSKVSKPTMDKPKKSIKLPLVEETPIRPSFDLGETYSLATTPPKKMFLFSFLRKTNKPLENTSLMLLKQQTSHAENLDSIAQEAEKSPSKIEPIETLYLEKSVENIKSDTVYANNTKQEDTVYINIPKKKLFKSFDALPSELNVSTTIPDNNTIVTAPRNLSNEIISTSKSEEVALGFSIVDASSESTTTNIPQVVNQEDLENATSLCEPKKGELLLEFSANSVKQHHISMVNYFEDVKLRSIALAEESTSKNLEEAGTSRMKIHSISDKSADSIRKRQTNEENNVEREVADKSVVEKNLKKLEKVSTERRSEKVSGTSLNPESKIRITSNQTLAGFETNTNTKDVCENHMKLEPQKLPETSESSLNNSVKSEIKINVTDKIIPGFKVWSGSLNKEPVEILEKLAETTKEVSSEDNSKKINKREVCFGKIKKTSEELVTYQRKTEKVSKEAITESKDMINGDSTKFSKTNHVNATEDRIPQQRKNRETEKSNIETKKLKQVIFENSSKSSDDVATIVVEVRNPQAALEMASKGLVVLQRKKQEISGQYQKPNKESERSVEVTIEEVFKPFGETRERYVDSKNSQEKSEEAAENLVIHQMKNKNTLDYTQKPNNKAKSSKEGSFKPSEEPLENLVKIKEIQEPPEVALEDLFVNQKKKIKTCHQPQKATKGLECSVKSSQNAIESHVELKKHQDASKIVPEDGVTHQNKNEKSNNKVRMSKEVIMEKKTFENSFQSSEEATQSNIELEESLKAPKVASEDKETKHSIGITLEGGSKSSKDANKSFIVFNKPQKPANLIQNDKTVTVPQSSWKSSEGSNTNPVEPEKCQKGSKNHVKVVSKEGVIRNSLMPSRIGVDKTDDASGPLQFVEGTQNPEQMSKKREKSVIKEEFPSYEKIHIISDRILRGSMAKITENIQETNKSENVEFSSCKSSEDAGVASKEPENKIIIISDWTLRAARTKITEFSQKSREPEPFAPQIEKAPSEPTKTLEGRNWRQERENSFDAIAARALQKTKMRVRTTNAENSLRKEEDIEKAFGLSENLSFDTTSVRLPQAAPELAKTGKLDFIKAKKDELKILDVVEKTEDTETLIAGGCHLRRTLENVRLNSSQPTLKQLAKDLKELSDDIAFRQIKNETAPSAIPDKLDKNLDLNCKKTSQNLVNERQPKKGFVFDAIEMENKSKSPGKKIEHTILKVKHQIELKQDTNAHKEVEERLFRIDDETPAPLVPGLDSEVLMAKDWFKSVADSNDGTKSVQIDFRKMAVKPHPRMGGFDTYLDINKRKRNGEKESKTKEAKLSLNVPIEFVPVEWNSGEFVSNNKLKQIYKLEEGINAGNEFTFRLKNRDVKLQYSSSEKPKSSSRGEDDKKKAEQKRNDSRLCIQSLESKREDNHKSKFKDWECYESETDINRHMKEEKDDRKFHKSTEKDQMKENRKYGEIYVRDITEEPKCKEKGHTDKSYTEKKGEENQKLSSKESKESPGNDAKSIVLLNEPLAVTELKYGVHKMEENDIDTVQSQGPFKPQDQEGSAKTIDAKSWLSKKPLTKAALKDMSQIPQSIDRESEKNLLTKIQCKAVNEVEILDKIKDVNASLTSRPATKAALKEIAPKPEKAQSKVDEVDINEVFDKEMSIVLTDEREEKPLHTSKIDTRTLEKLKRISQGEKPLDDVLEAKVSSSSLKEAEIEEFPEDTFSNLKVQRYEESFKELQIDVTLDDDQNIKLKQQLILEPDFAVMESIIAQKDITSSQELSVPLLEAVDKGAMSEHIQDAFSYLQNVAKFASEDQSVSHELLPNPLLLETALESGQCLETSDPEKGVVLPPSKQQPHQLSTSDSTLGSLINFEGNSREFYVMLDKDRLTSQVNRKRKFTEQNTCEQVKKLMLLDKPDDLKQVDLMNNESIAAFDSLKDAFLREQDKPCHTLVVGDCVESQHKFFSAEHEYYSEITDTVETAPILNFNFDYVEDTESVATTLSEAVSSTATFPSSFQMFGHNNTQEHSQLDGLRSGDNEEKWVVRYYCPEDVGQIWSEYLHGEDQGKIETDQYETMDKMIGESQSREDVLEASDINMGADTLGDANWTFLDNYMEELVIEEQVSVPFDIDDKPAIQQQIPDNKHLVSSGIVGLPEPVGTHQPFPIHDVYFDAELQHAAGMGLLNNLPDTLNHGKKSTDVPVLKSAKEDFVSSLNFNIAAINNIMEFSQPTIFPDINFSDTQLLLNTSPEAPVEMRKTRKEKVVDASPSDTLKPSKTAETESNAPNSKSSKRPQHVVSFLRTSKETGYCPSSPKIGVASTPDISMRDLVVGSREPSGNTRVHRSMNHYQPVFPATVVYEERSSEPPLKRAKGKRVTQSPKNSPQSRGHSVLLDEPSLRLKTRSSMRQYPRKFASDASRTIKTGSKTSNSIKLRQSKKNIKPTDVDPFDLLKSSPNMNPSFRQQQTKRGRAADNEKSPQTFDAKQPNKSSTHI
ncbi:titin homolog isoform X2 [Euwallacea fornicatus]|uniref:titin homolog isoform X2 n=1 Tax=Euwallacea fornicatus TaxID=995702 RepID=UPI00338EB56B